jgi:hypothetical protein
VCAHTQLIISHLQPNVTERAFVLGAETHGNVRKGAESTNKHVTQPNTVH